MLTHVVREIFQCTNRSVLCNLIWILTPAMTLAVDAQVVLALALCLALPSFKDIYAAGVLVAGSDNVKRYRIVSVPNTLHYAYMGRTQSHVCWWLLAALPIRLPELGCLIPKQCLLLPISPLMCVHLLTHHMRNYFGIVSVYGLSFSGVSGLIWEKAGSHALLELSAAHCYTMVRFVSMC